MSKQCHFTGKKTMVGCNVARSGAAVKKGGFGLHVSGRTKRKFKPNLQKVYAMIDGVPRKVNVSTRAIRNGMVVKPLKRRDGYTRQQKLQSS